MNPSCLDKDHLVISIQTIEAGNLFDELNHGLEQRGHVKSKLFPGK